MAQPPEYHPMTAPYGVRVVYGALPRAIMTQSPAIVRRAELAAIRAAMPFLQRKLALATPTGATGLARSSVTAEMATGSVPSGFVGYGGMPSLYIRFVEEGTRPHWPPLAPLAYWAARKFGYPVGSPEAKRAGYLVARKISRVGTKGQHFVEKTADAHRAKAQDLMRRAALGVFHSIGR